MNRGLWLLWLLRARGTLRRLWSRPGISLLLIIGGFLALMVVPGPFIKEEVSPHLLFPFAAFFLLTFTVVITLWDWTSMNWQFWPAEVEQLFPRPVSRREILAYRHLNTIAFSCAFAAAGAAWFSHALRGYWNAFAAILLLCLIAAALGSLLAQWLLFLSRWRPGVERAMRWSILPLLVAGIWEITRAFPRAFELETLLFDDLAILAEALRETWFASILLFPSAPVELMIRALDTETFLFGLAGGVVVYIVLYGTALWLDQDFRMHAFLRTSQLDAAIQQARMGNGAILGPRRRRSRTRIPFPYWAGFGPLAWCHLIRQGELFRRMVKGCGSACILAIGAHYLFEREIQFLIPFMWTWLAVLGSGSGNNGSSDSYQGLPLRPLTLACGLVFPTAIRDFLLIGAVTILLGISIGQLPWALLLTAFLFPVNILSKAAGEGIALLLQSSLHDLDPVRTTWSVFLSMGIEIALFCAAAVLAISVFLVTGLLTSSLAWAVFAAWGMILLIGLAFVGALIRSLQMPTPSRPHDVGRLVT